jgi:hypothetical protein
MRPIKKIILYKGALFSTLRHSHHYYGILKQEQSLTVAIGIKSHPIVWLKITQAWLSQALLHKQLSMNEEALDKYM